MICRIILHSFAFLPHYFISMFHVPHKDRNLLTGDSPLAANNLGILAVNELLVKMDE